MRLVAILSILLSAPAVLALPLPNVPLPHAVPLLSPKLLTDVQGAYSLGLTSRGEPVVSNGNSIWKYDTQGNVQWARDRATVVTVDSNDNIITAQTASVIAYRPDGSMMWKTPLNAITIPRGVTTDAARNVYVAAYEYGVNTGEVWKLTPTGSIQWHTTVSPIFLANIMWGIAVSNDGTEIAAATQLGTYMLNGAGALVWQNSISSTRAVIDDQGNVYTGRQQGADPLGFPKGYLVKFSPTGTILWNQPEAALHLTLIGNRVITVNELVLGTFLPSPLPGVAGFTIDAYDTTTGLWQWGFKHISRTWTGTLFSFGGNAATRPGYLAFGADNYDTAVYDTNWIINACDATPLISPPDQARACIFIDA